MYTLASFHGQLLQASEEPLDHALLCFVVLCGAEQDARTQSGHSCCNPEWPHVHCIQPAIGTHKQLMTCNVQVNLGSTSDAVESVANVTDIHEAMFFHADDEVSMKVNTLQFWNLVPQMVPRWPGNHCWNWGFIPVHL